MSDKELKMKNKIRDHLNASFARESSLSRSKCSAFLQGNSWTGTVKYVSEKLYPLVESYEKTER
ncbi:hypothetical protein Lal_00045980 [Lupinus albus]|nr:hypothetical protein Lal_00045980 [Lupinus albus]